MSKYNDIVNDIIKGNQYNDGVTCKHCRYGDRSGNEYPCKYCVRLAIDYWLPTDEIINTEMRKK